MVSSTIMFVKRDSFRITSFGKSILDGAAKLHGSECGDWMGRKTKNGKKTQSVIMRYKYLIFAALAPNLEELNQIKVKHEPSHDLICIQIVDEDFGWARNFEIFEGPRYAGIQRPQAVARVDFQSVD